MIAAFFADQVEVYDGKLNVLGGVWDWIVVGELPAERELRLAVILQTDGDDVGQTRTLDLAMTAPSGAAVGRAEVGIALHGPDRTEHLSLALSLPVRLEELGRHVATASVDGEPHLAVPLSVQVPPPV